MSNAFDSRPTLLSTFKGFKDQGYTYASAISEFIDNSISSFCDNEATIEKYKKAGKPLERSISIILDKQSKKNKLIIRDSAFGIEEKDFQRSLRIGERKKEQGGLNEFGKGMKSAGFWFGKNVHVLTRSYFDLARGKEYKDGAEYGLYWNQIKNDDAMIMPKKVDAQKSKWRLNHGTVVMIEDLYEDRIFSNTEAKKILEKIASNYRIDILNHNLKIRFYVFEPNGILDINEWVANGGNKKLALLKGNNLKSGRALTFKPVKRLVDPKTGLNVEVNFDFEVEFNGNKLPVRGVLFQKETGSRNKNTGIDLIRRGRIIEESYQEFYTDKSGMKYQRITGEMHLDEFPVTQTKDKLMWEGELFELVKEKLLNLKEVKEFEKCVVEYRSPAKNKKSDFSNKDLVPGEKDLNISKHFQITMSTPKQNQKMSSEVHTIEGDVVYNVKTLSVDEEQKIISRLSTGENMTDWLDIEEVAEVMIVKLNINHNFFNPFNDMKENGSFGRSFIKMLRTFSIYWALAEKTSLHKKYNASQFRELLGNLIERN